MTSDMVVSRYRNRKTLENILGAWYNTDEHTQGRTNTVYYMTPASVTYHTRWRAPEMVNRSHPIPCVFDLALWTSTKKFFYDSRATMMSGHGYAPALCNRWSSQQGHALSPSDYGRELAFIVGCQMVMDVGRTPKAWFKYAMRLHEGQGKLNPCPKTDWEWFLCINCLGPNMRFGAEPGAALHVCPITNTFRYKGLAGLNSFAMKLRSKNFVNYFTLLDRHPVLDWLYDSMKGRVKPDYTDFRFESDWDEPLKIKAVGVPFVAQVYPAPVDYAKEPYTPPYKPIFYR